MFCFIVDFCEELVFEEVAFVLCMKPEIVIPQITIVGAANTFHMLIGSMGFGMVFDLCL